MASLLLIRPEGTAVDGTFTFFITSLISLFAVIDPLGIVPIFLLMTPDKGEAERRAIAAKASLTVFIILTLFALFGDWILTFFGISPEAFQIAGGLILIKLAYDLLWAHTPGKLKSSQKEEEQSRLKEDISIIPLSMPLLSGPGAISTVVALAQPSGSLLMRGLLVLSIFINALVVYFILVRSTYISRVIRETGSALLSRILGLIVMAVGVQFILGGLSAFWK